MKIGKTRKRVLVVSYMLAVIAVLGTVAYRNNSRAEHYRLQLENAYSHAFTELVNGVGELDTALQKTLYATSPSMVSAVCAEVYGKALSAQYALGELPFSSYKYRNMSSFITKTGDYAYMLSKKAATGAEGTEEEHQNLVKLSTTATVLSGNLNQLLVEGEGADASPGKIGILSDALSSAGDQAAETGNSDVFALMEQEFPETPSLIYDGPFSSHIAGLSPKLLEGKPEITAAEAQSRAGAFLGMKSIDVKIVGERGGSLPVYVLTAPADGGAVTVEVSKRGGVVVTQFNGRTVENAVMSTQDAAKIAMRFLAAKGWSGMTQSYEMQENNILTVNFAYQENSVIFYPDLIKVSVGLDNGCIMGFESQGYVMNHTVRQLPQMKIKVAAAQAKVSKFLKVLSHDLAVIPTVGKNEVFCHEFKCENESGSHYIVYVNAVTGVEEKILILQESDQGTLTL